MAHFYTAELSAKPGIEQYLLLPRGDEHVYMIYPIVMKDAKHKGPLTLHLEEHGIETRDLLPLLGQPVYKKMLGDLLEKYPVAKMLDACGFYIGCHQHVDDESVRHVVDTPEAELSQPADVREHHASGRRRGHPLLDAGECDFVPRTSSVPSAVRVNLGRR